MTVRISYSLKNDYIDVDIFRDPEKNKLVPVNLKETSRLKYPWQPIMATHILIIIALMPSAIGMEESLKKLAELFKEWALDIIRGKEWISIDMLRSMKGPGKPE